MDLLTIFGATGTVIILIAFLLNQSNKLKNDSLIYDSLNALGSLILVIYALQINSIPFIVINIIWGLSSLMDVISALLKKQKK